MENYIHSFVIENKKVIIGSSFYPTTKIVTLDNVKVGTWYVKVSYRGKGERRRISKFFAYHTDYNENDEVAKKEIKIKKPIFNVGIFDEKYFDNEKGVPENHVFDRPILYSSGEVAMFYSLVFETVRNECLCGAFSHGFIAEVHEECPFCKYCCFMNNDEEIIAFEVIL